MKLYSSSLVTHYSFQKNIQNIQAVYNWTTVLYNFYGTTQDMTYIGIYNFANRWFHQYRIDKNKC